MNREIELRELLGILFDGKYIIILITLISALTGGVMSYYFITPVYQSRADLLISQTSTENALSNLSLGEIESNLKLIESYQFIVKSRRVMEKTAESLGVEYKPKELLEKIKVETNGNSQILSVIVEDSDAGKAAEIANTVSKVFQSEIKSILKLENIHLLSLATAEESPEPIRPRPLLNSMIALVVGLVLSIGIVFLKKYSRTNIGSKQDVTDHLSLPTLGEVPLFNGRSILKNSLQYSERYYKMVTHIEKNVSIAEFYRSIRTNIQFQNNAKGFQTILFTSSNPGEGKSITTGNLAILMSMDHKKTVFVDVDLRKPNGHQMFGFPNRQGVTSYLAGNEGVETIIRKTNVPNLSFIPAGAIPPNPSELLSSEKMQQLLLELGSRFDYIFLDCPPMIVSDAAILAMKADGCIFVINAQKNSRQEVKQRIENLQQVNSNLLGVILNKTKTKVGAAYYY